MTTEAGEFRGGVRLTPSLVLLVVALGLIAGFRPAVASPTTTAVVWAGLMALVMIGVIWPLAEPRALRLRILRCPTDMIEGVPAVVEFGLTRRGFPLRIELDPSLGAFEPARGAFISGDQLVVTAVMARRGAHAELAVLVTDFGPFGLLRVGRVMRCKLPNPLFVGPVPADDESLIDPSGIRGDRSVSTEAALSGDTVRSVRRYVVGDPAHLVHWRSSAHAGELMVKELEPTGDGLVAVVVDLRTSDVTDASGDPIERAVRLAARVLKEALDQAMPVVLCTAEATGPVAARVHDRLDAQRRLAAAVGGVPGAVPGGCIPIVISPHGVEASPQ